jgi:hypothetical protein
MLSGPLGGKVESNHLDKVGRHLVRVEGVGLRTDYYA